MGQDPSDRPHRTGWHRSPVLPSGVGLLGTALIGTVLFGAVALDTVRSRADLPTGRPEPRAHATAAGGLPDTLSDDIPPTGSDGADDPASSGPGAAPDGAGQGTGRVIEASTGDRSSDDGCTGRDRFRSDDRRVHRHRGPDRWYERTDPSPDARRTATDAPELTRNERPDPADADRDDPVGVPGRGRPEPPRPAPDGAAPPDASARTAAPARSAPAEATPTPHDSDEPPADQPEIAEPVAPAWPDATVSAAPDPAQAVAEQRRFARSLVYTGAGSAIIALAGLILVHYRRRQW